jgi:hypothetical protein
MRAKTVLGICLLNDIPKLGKVVRRLDGKTGAVSRFVTG